MLHRYMQNVPGMDCVKAIRPFILKNLFRKHINSCQCCHTCSDANHRRNNRHVLLCFCCSCSLSSCPLQ